MISRGFGSDLALLHVLTYNSKEEFEICPCLVSFEFLSPKFSIVCVTSLEDNLVSSRHYLFSRVSIISGFSESDSVIDLRIERLDRLVRVVRGP